MKSAHKLTNQASPKLIVAPTVRPWYKEFYVWMVIAGPVSAMLACAVTAVFIFQGPDAEVTRNFAKEGLALDQEVSKALPGMQPAKTGRNHSATAGQARDKP